MNERYTYLLVRFSNAERSFFAKRLAFMLRAGVPLVDALTLVSEQTRSRMKARAFARVMNEVRSGLTLSQSIERHASSMSTFVINLIAVGERAGALPENLGYLADELTKRYALARKVRSALIYPAIVLCATIAVTALLTLFVFPRVMPVFISLGIDLPWTTRTLLSVSEFLSEWGLQLITLIACTVFALFVVRARVESCGYLFDRVIVTIPIIGPIVRAYNMANLCRTLALLLKSGVTAIESLEIAAHATENRAYRRALLRAMKNVTHGGTIARSLSQERSLIDDMLPHLVMVGETTGTLTDTLTYLARFFEEEVDERTKNLGNTIEPVLLIAMGAIVGFVAISIITPIYDITKNLHQR